MWKYVPIQKTLSRSNSENALGKLPHLHQALKDKKWIKGVIKRGRPRAHAVGRETWNTGKCKLISPVGSATNIINIPGNDLSIMQISHSIMCKFISKQQVNAENCTQLEQVAWKCTKCTHLHTSHQLPQFAACWVTPAHICSMTCHPPLDNPPSSADNNSHATILLTTTSTCKI